MYDLHAIRWDSLKIGRELGEGSFAKVYLGRWKDPANSQHPRNILLWNEF